MTYDAIVVGAGPAGSTAAIVLSQNGLRVLLVDREAFPREKPCGDAVPAIGFKLLSQLGLDVPYDSGDFFLVDKGVIRGPQGSALTVPMLTTSESAARVVTRYVFDNMLYQYALKCGAEFCPLNVTGPIIENGKVVGVIAKSGKESAEYRSKIVIAADGATSTIARALKVPPRADKYRAVAIRGYVETAEDLDSTIDMSFLKDIQPGYGWLFPLRKRYANIGVGLRADVYKRSKTSLPEALKMYVNSPPIKRLVGDHEITDIKSWQLPLASTEQKRVFDGAILVGDAGGFVNPLTGAGIYSGMATGRYAAMVAADAIKANDVSAQRLQSFETLWRQELQGEMKRSTLVQNILNVAPKMMDAMLFTTQKVPGIAHFFIGKL